MTRVKACGLTNVEDARLATELGAWALGMVFWAPSPRACSLEAAERIAAELRRRTELAGVFVNATLDELAGVAERCELSILQLHGDEGPAYCREAARRTGAKVMKAVRVKHRASITALGAFHVDFHLLDAHAEDRPGGTGTTFNWELASGHRGPVPVVLSGGLTPENVSEGIGAVRPFAVDVASGTEAAAGRKDPVRMRELFAEVAAADRELTPA